jgi:hypothetical protein
LRIRTIKPDFWTHPEILACTIPARVLLASMFNQADDEGRMHDNPLRIGANAFGPDDKVNVKALLIELGARGRICRYMVGERSCIHVLNFLRHQRIDRPTPSVIPPCELHEDSTNGPRAIPAPREEASSPDMEVEGKWKGKEESKDAGASFSDTRPNESEVLFAEKINAAFPGSSGRITLPTIQKWNSTYGPRPTTDALRQVHGFPPEEAIQSPYAYVSSILQAGEAR